MLSFPNCKINLGLFVTRRRADGYHDLATVFYPLPLHDALEIVPATGATRLHLSGHTLQGNPEDNLVWKAWQLLHTAYPQQVPPVDIYLHKKIPAGAGLGGGSADGACMLTLLNDRYHLGLDKKQLSACALQLGSDCPFFIHNTPQYATGRGELMTPVPIDLSPYSIQLICPELHVSTAAAFRAITPQPAPFDLRRLHTLPVTEWKTVLRNDFEAPVFKMHSTLQTIREQMYEQGALYTSMTGSGSAFYGVFSKGQKAGIELEVAFKEFSI